MSIPLANNVASTLHAVLIWQMRAISVDSFRTQLPIQDQNNNRKNQEDRIILDELTLLLPVPPTVVVQVALNYFLSSQKAEHNFLLLILKGMFYTKRILPKNIHAAVHLVRISNLQFRVLEKIKLF